MKKYQLLAAIFCSLTTFAHAAEEPILEEIVVTATRIEQPLKQTLSSTTVITQEDIKNSQAADVPTILRSVAGVEISQSGGYGKSASIFLRGSNSTQVLVLVDGVRINSATTGTTSIEHLMLDQIERIEVVRGNVSSLYGSEAIGGVVQIFTKRGHGSPAFNVSAGTGTHGTQRAAAGFGGSIENTDFNLNVSRFIIEGISAINSVIAPDANPDKDGYENTSFSANVRHTLNVDHVLSVSAYNSKGENQYDNAFGVNTDINSNKSQVSKYSIATEDKLTDSWESKLQLSQGTDAYRDFKNGTPTLNWFGLPSSKFQTDNTQLSWQNKIRLDATKQLLVGAEYLGQQVSSDMQPAYVQTERKVNSLFAGYTGNYGAHQLQTNIRQDNNSQYGAANTGLLGYGYSISDSWRATTSYSTAFRAPTFNELYYPGWGKSDLRPEQSRNLDIGLHYTNDVHHFDLAYFDNHTTDLIDSTPKNINEARIDGVELSYSAQMDGTVIKIAASSQNPRDLITGEMLLRRAKQYGNLNISQKFGSLTLATEWQYSGEREDSHITAWPTQRVILSAYNVVNIAASYALDKHLRITMRADNLFDENYVLAHGYNTFGRTFFAGISYQQ